ncbi:hypothetical protein JHW43_005834 [Diplocarpon mali]|nr:hypothetical protein JHW43_005834 [Diplocarpon mali]
MFQPQPTPFAFGLSRGAIAPLPEVAGFQHVGVGGVLDHGGPTVFRDRGFSPVAAGPPPRNLNYHHNHPHNHHDLHIHAPGPANNHSAGLPSYHKMTGQDIEAQEAMARDYNPVLEGPLVGDRMSSTAIAEEYAKADPIYVTKTAALPHKYSHYRPVLGDGNCGWRGKSSSMVGTRDCFSKLSPPSPAEGSAPRTDANDASAAAVGFSYFETLIRLRDRSQLEEEVARMISLNNLLATAGGFDSWLFEDMVEETTILLKELALLVETAPRGAADVLWQQFNKLEVSNSIVYHLRLLASSWMKANPILYQGFIPDSSGVEGYVKNTLMPVNQEIDHLGVTLLIDVLLKPIGFSVEIVYLDRSPGAQVNSHIFQPEDANGIPTNPSGPMIHLLYRPSHYDILYKDQAPPIRAVEDASGATNLQVNRATNFSQHLAIQSTPASMGGFAQLDILSCIPGFSLGPQPAHHGFSPQYSQQLEPYPPSPLSASLSPTSPDASSLAATSSNISASFPAPPAPAQTPFPPPTSQLAILTHNPPLSPTAGKTSFRPSVYEFQAVADWQEGPVVFQTSTFKNSHYNTAHYNNPNFQPEEWTPESEEIPGKKRPS